MDFISTHLLLKAASGQVAIMTLAPIAGAREKALAAFSATNFVPASVTEIDHADVPTDRSFRDAWVFDGVKIGHDMAKAREIHRERIRKLRKIIFKQLDTDGIIAMEAGNKNKVDEIVAKKNAARDAPADPRIDAATTIAQLKLIEPLASLVDEYKDKIHPSFIEEAKHV